MRLIYLHQYFKFPDESGGTRSYDLAKSFCENGIDVIVISSTSDIKYKKGKRWVVKIKDGLCVNYIYLPYDNKLSNFKRIIVFSQFLWFATFRLLKLKANVIIATSTPLTIGIPTLVKKRIDGTPFIFEVRDVWPEAVIAIGVIKNTFVKRFLFFCEKSIYKNASAIIPLSSDMKKSIISRYPNLIAKPIEVIENISELKRFQNPESYEESVLKKSIGFIPRFTILYAGTFGKVNGIEYVINLAEKTLLIDSSIVFVLIGSGVEKDQVISLARKKDVLGKNVFILKSIPKNDLPRLYSEVSMGSSFVINIEELWANSANKFFDTLAAGKPVLINHKGWQKDVIINDNLGYVLPVELKMDDIKKFVEYTLARDIHEIQKVNAFKKAKDFYSLDVAVNKYLSILNKFS